MPPVSKTVLSRLNAANLSGHFIPQRHPNGDPAPPILNTRSLDAYVARVKKAEQDALARFQPGDRFKHVQPPIDSGTLEPVRKKQEGCPKVQLPWCKMQLPWCRHAIEKFAVTVAVAAAVTWAITYLVMYLRFWNREFEHFCCHKRNLERIWEGASVANSTVKATCGPVAEALIGSENCPEFNLYVLPTSFHELWWGTGKEDE